MDGGVVYITRDAKTVTPSAVHRRQAAQLHWHTRRLKTSASGDSEPRGAASAGAGRAGRRAERGERGGGINLVRGGSITRRGEWHLPHVGVSEPVSNMLGAHEHHIEHTVALRH